MFLGWKVHDKEQSTMCKGEREIERQCRSEIVGLTCSA